MLLAPIPVNEKQRLEALQNLNILDTESEERFDRIVSIAQYSFDVPVAFIALVDKDRVWFKSSHNYVQNQGSRDISFCGHAICNIVTNDISSRLFEVSSAEYDERFFDNPYVTESNGIRYYLAFILRSKEGYNVGTLCLVDTRPRAFSAREKKVFSELGFIAEAELNDNQYNSNFLASNNMHTSNECIRKLTRLSTKLHLIQKKFDDYFKSKEFNYKEWCILNEIADMESASPNLLSQKLGVTPSVMTRKLEALEIKRLIKRWNSKDGDKRYVRLACTKRGIEFWQKGINQVRHFATFYLEDRN